MTVEQRFNELLPRLTTLVDKRKNSWKLQKPEWEDVRQDLLIHIWQKFPQYDPNRPVDNWANVLITRQIMNILRDSIYKSARPCIAADSYGNPCVHNRGGNSCAFTHNKIQCAQCPLYAKWQKRKEAQANLASPLSLENHLDESRNMQCDFIDIEGAKKQIDEKIMERLTPADARLYKLLFIQHLSVEEVGKRLKCRPEDKNKLNLQITKAKKRFKLLTVEIIHEFNLA